MGLPMAQILKQAAAIYGRALRAVNNGPPQGQWAANYGRYSPLEALSLRPVSRYS